MISFSSSSGIFLFFSFSGNDIHKSTTISRNLTFICHTTLLENLQRLPDLLLDLEDRVLQPRVDLPGDPEELLGLLAGHVLDLGRAVLHGGLALQFRLGARVLANFYDLKRV